MLSRQFSGASYQFSPYVDSPDASGRDARGDYFSAPGRRPSAQSDGMETLVDGVNEHPLQDNSPVLRRYRSSTSIRETGK